MPALPVVPKIKNVVGKLNERTELKPGVFFCLAAGFFQQTAKKQDRRASFFGLQVPERIRVGVFRPVKFRLKNPEQVCPEEGLPVGRQNMFNTAR